MGETPNIVMKCPKCGKRFPLDQTCCETCSAMLEPFETEQEGPAPSAEDLKRDADEQPAVTDEKIEDIKIDRLRVDIENKFAYTLLLGMDQLKKRLAGKQKYLDGIQEKEGPGHPQRVAGTGKAEAATDEIMKKITKLEMMLDNPKHKLTDDISALDAELGKLERPGVGPHERKRPLFRMLSSELKTKKLILDVIQGKKSPAVLRLMDLLRPIFLVPNVTAVAIISALSIYTYAPNVPPGLRMISGPKTPQGNPAIISESDIDSLLDGIRTADLKKDNALWKSRYSRGYLASSEKRENIVEQWEKVNYKSLSDKVEDLRSGPAHASATVIWDVNFSPRKSAAIKKIRQRLPADFAIEDGRLKITPFVKEESK